MNKKYHHKRKDMSLKELSKLIVEAIESEQFFNKETLIPKVKSIMSGFQLNMNFTRYNALKSPSKTAKLIKANQDANWEKVFWMRTVKELVGEEKIEDYYKMRDDLRESLNIPKM